MSMQPVAETNVGYRQRFAVANILGNLAQRERHDREDKQAYNQMQRANLFR